MKKVQVIFGVVLLMLSLFLINCNKDKLGISFEINDSFDFTMESGSIINLPFDILTPDVTTNSAGEFEQNDTRADKIKEIKLLEKKEIYLKSLKEKRDVLFARFYILLFINYKKLVAEMIVLRQIRIYQEEKK